ncbi:MAG: potassium channel family protein [Gemmatimonadales bacterium]|nr:potassium channel family protein [Gemmatimonadales bacterium]
MTDQREPPAASGPTERLVVLSQLEGWIERPMQVLGFAWLGLLVVELTYGLSPLLEVLSTAIWVVFILDFLIRLVLAPAKGKYLRSNWLVAVSLLFPALRVLRVARAIRPLGAARAIRGVRLVRVVSTVNRGMRALGRSMGRRGLGYIVALTLLVTAAGAAGMLAFEREVPGGSISDYPTALWWTAMIMTTLGSEYWPRTAEGRLLCILLALYAFAAFGYLTASLATYFIGRDAEASDGELAGAASIEALRLEIESLRAELRGR